MHLSLCDITNGDHNELYFPTQMENQMQKGDWDLSECKYTEDHDFNNPKVFSDKRVVMKVTSAEWNTNFTCIPAASTDWSIIL